MSPNASGTWLSVSSAAPTAPPRLLNQSWELVPTESLVQGGRRVMGHASKRFLALYRVLYLYECLRRVQVNPTDALRRIDKRRSKQPGDHGNSAQTCHKRLELRTSERNDEIRRRGQFCTHRTQGPTGGTTIVDLGVCKMLINRGKVPRTATFYFRRANVSRWSRSIRLTKMRF